MIYRWRVIVVIFLVLFFCGFLSKLHGQTMGVSVITGGVVQFQFTSFQKIKNGIKYPGFTKLKIISVDPDVACKGWTLYCRSTSDAVLSDDGIPANGLSLDKLVITPHLESSSFPGSLTLIPFSLSNSLVKIAECTTVGLYDSKSAIISLDFSFAEGTGLIGVKPDYYYLDLEFKIVENP